MTRRRRFPDSSSAMGSARGEGVDERLDFRTGDACALSKPPTRRSTQSSPTPREPRRRAIVGVSRGRTRAATWRDAGHSRGTTRPRRSATPCRRRLMLTPCRRLDSRPKRHKRVSFQPSLKSASRETRPSSCGASRSGRMKGPTCVQSAHSIHAGHGSARTLNPCAPAALILLHA